MFSLCAANGWQLSLCSTNYKNVFTSFLFFSQQLTGFHFVQQMDNSFYCVQKTTNNCFVLFFWPTADRFKWMTDFTVFSKRQKRFHVCFLANSWRFSFCAANGWQLSLCSANSWQAFTPCSKWLTAFTVFRKQVFTFVFKPTADEFSVCAAVSNKLSLCSEKNKNKKNWQGFTLCSKQKTRFHCMQQMSHALSIRAAGTDKLHFVQQTADEFSLCSANSPTSPHYLVHKAKQNTRHATEIITHFHTSTEKAEIISD